MVCCVLSFGLVGARRMMAWRKSGSLGPIAAAGTGQFNGGGQIWNGGLDLAGPSGDGQAAPRTA